MYAEADRTLALAGIFQAASLTRQLAREGSAPPDALAASVHSLFQFDPPDVATVFDGTAGVAHGLQSLIEHLSRPDQKHRETTGYVIALLQLERRLARNPDALAALGEELAAVQRRQLQHALSDSTRYAALADIYQRHISTLTPRIMVKGEPLHLQNPDTAARIRTVLLAGIRAARLWRQCGGQRWQLLFGRTRAIRTAKDWLRHM